MSEGRAEQKHGLPNVFRLSLIAACALALLVFLFLREPEIRFLLPAGFHGGFIIVEDPDGTDLGGAFASTYVVTIPPSRVVKVKSFAPFRFMHTESIQVGRKGQISMVDLDPSDDAVQLRCMGTGERQEHGIEYRERLWYVLGTAAEAEAFDPWSLFPES